MNSEKKDILGAIGGNAADKNGVVEPDYKALYEEAQKELQTNKVEDGRLRKVNEELAAARKELDELRRSKRTEDAIGALPEDLQDMPDDIKRGAAIIAEKAVETAVGGAMAETNDRLARLEKEREESRASAERIRKDEFERRLSYTYYDFLKGISDGGDKREAWMKYRRFNEASIQSAIASCDYDTLEYHIKNFYREIDVPVPTAGQAYIAPEPRPFSGGAPAIPHGGGKTYTLDEYVALQEKCEKLFYENKAAYSELRDELEKAMAEGRVKRE